jgi:hypothetical protein
MAYSGNITRKLTITQELSFNKELDEELLQDHTRLACLGVPALGDPREGVWHPGAHPQYT